MDELIDEYSEAHGWFDGVVPDENLTYLGIDVGPGTGVSDGGARVDD